MKKLYTKLFDLLEIGDDFPTVIMGVINLSPESFYLGSVYVEPDKIRDAASEMIKSGAQILDIGHCDVHRSNRRDADIPLFRSVRHPKVRRRYDGSGCTDRHLLRFGFLGQYDGGRAD